MWKTIGGFVVSNFAEVFVKELVKEVTKSKKPAPQKESSASSTSKTMKSEPKQPIVFTKGQVMVLEWVPTSKQETNDRDTKNEEAPPAGREIETKRTVR